MKKKPVKESLTGRLRKACDDLSYRERTGAVLSMLLILFVLAVYTSTRSVLRFRDRGRPQSRELHNDSINLDLPPEDSAMYVPFSIPDDGNER